MREAKESSVKNCLGSIVLGIFRILTTKAPGIATEMSDRV